MLMTLLSLFTFVMRNLIRQLVIFDIYYYLSVMIGLYVRISPDFRCNISPLSHCLPLKYNILVLPPFDNYIYGNVYTVILLRYIRCHIVVDSKRYNVPLRSVSVIPWRHPPPFMHA